MIVSNISNERKKYLKSKRRNKTLIFLTQIGILIGFIILWETLANANIIDSFIMSKPSRIIETFSNLASNDLIKHLWVTVYETLVGFLLGTILGSFVAILLWCSPFLSKVLEPFLVVLNSLPKVALRSSNNNLGWSRNRSNNLYGNSYIFGSFYIRNFRRI